MPKPGNSGGARLCYNLGEDYGPAVSQGSNEITLVSDFGLERVTLEDFSQLIGESFEASIEEGGETMASVTLVSASSRGHSRGPEFRTPFSLVFEGPSSVPFVQQILWLSNPKTGTMNIFVVPIGDDSQIRRYEAIFN